MAEDQAVLRAGLATASFISVDDTDARHARRDGITTQIGGSRFSVFRTGRSKSRLNFLSLLRAGCEDYIINDAALDYMRHRKMAPDVISKLAAHPETSFASQMAWYDHLVRLRLDVFDRTLVREITEAALWGAVRHHGLMGNTVVVSDDAGQFRIPNHALCWVHLWMPPLLQGYSVLRHVPRLRSSIRPVATMRPAPSASMVKSASRAPITRDELKARCTLDLPWFRSGLLRAMLSPKETGYGSDTQRRVQSYAGKWVTGFERAAYRGGCRSLPELPKGTIRHGEDYRHHPPSSAGIC